MRKTAVALALFVWAFAADAAETLRVVSAGPVGETATLAEANEVRVVFSEPMVTLGRIPQPVTAPFFNIQPAVKGTFRWSGTTTLIFTPAEPLPYATQYTVTIEKSAKAVSGNTLDRPYQWTFTTPTIRLAGAEWYRKPNGAVVIGMRFNQPVRAATITPYLRLTTAAHPIEVPPIPPAGVERLRRVAPQALQAYEAKRAKSLATASSDGQPILAFVASEWDETAFRPSPNLVVMETKPGIPPDTAIRIAISESVAPSPRRVRGGRVQDFVLVLDPMFFVSGMDCVKACDPERYNAIQFRTGRGVRLAEVARATTVTDVTERVVKPKKVDSEHDYPGWGFGLDDLGYSLEPGRTYAIRIDPSLRAEDGQTLGYTWVATVENWHRSAFVSFGAGHGVWESTGGSVLPFHVRNFRSVKQWLAPLSIEELMPTMLRLRETGATIAPDVPPVTRRIDTPVDQIASVGVDLKPVIGDDNRGLAWAAVEGGNRRPKTIAYNPGIVSSLIQATNLGISVKDSPLNTLVMVTRLDNAQPVVGAKVTIRRSDNSIFWSGTTNANGIAIAPNTDLRRAETQPDDDQWEVEWRATGELHFVVIAEKDGDVAYVGSDWNEGITPWELGVEYDVSEADPQLRGTIFADRGVYKLGEEVHFKLIARADTPEGMKLLAPGTKLDVVVLDSHAKEIDKRTVEVNVWSSADWTFRVPQDAPLGTYAIQAQSDAEQRGRIHGEILVAAYRRPDFRVDTTVTAATTLAGTNLDGRITGRYLFGGAMAGKDVSWTYAKVELAGAPQKITERFPKDRWAFAGRDWEDGNRGPNVIAQKQEKLDASGELRLTLDTQKDAGVPYEYRLEVNVTDVTRQQIAGRDSFRVDPAPWYIGVRRPPFFTEAKKGIETEIVAAGLDGLAVPGVNVKVELTRMQWVSVRQAEGQGFYQWRSELKKIPAGEWTVTTRADAVPLQVPLTEGGQYLLTARAEDGERRSTATHVTFYAVGEGYTAWERHDHNRIELVPEKRTYRPGETARIMIKSPWERATALLTTEREGIRTWTPFELTSTQQTITVPITEREIPNVYVSVLLVKGRTEQDPGTDGSDPGKPAFRLGYVELSVEDASKRLEVDVKANRDEFRPAAKARIDVAVRDAAGKPVQSEVTLWAVDYGVLSLTDYQTPDVLDTIYLDKALQVMNEDSRQKIVSRRVLTPKGASEGGGGGRDAGPGTLRKDFRVLAFWVGSLVTGANGRARTEVTLPESLTTYRIMAVAADRESRFGSDQAEIRINKQLVLTPAWPRFLAVGDKAHFGAVVHNQLKRGGKATVSIESLDPDVVEVGGSQQVSITPGAATEVRFDAAAKKVGDARIRMRVKMGRETDAFEDVIPVRVLVSPETVAAYGEAKPSATESLELPAAIVPGFGGLRVELASTAMVGLAEGARYLIEYPYGCAEQRASRALALMLAADLAEAFSLPGIEPGKEKARVQSALNELAKFECGDGGFAFWPGHCDSTSPYLTSYIAHVFQRAGKLGYSLDDDMLARVYDYLDRRLAEPPPVNEGWRPAYNAWQAFAVRTLAIGGRNVDSHLNRIYDYRERMPVFGLAFLLDALHAKGDVEGPRASELRRRINNSILPEGGHAHVNELNDPYLEWLWSSNVRSTAIALGTLVRAGDQEQMVRRMVRWLMTVRQNGRWGNTQENAWALGSLVDYYRRYESETPDFAATVAIGDETIAREEFRGRSTEARTRQFSMQEVLAKGAAGARLPVVFTRDGTGTLFYMLRLRYAANVLRHEALDRGFRIERTYMLSDGTTPATEFGAGDLIRVTLRIRNTKERQYVAVTDPVPAGTEPVETWFATTATSLVEEAQRQPRRTSWAWWDRAGWDHVERHDDRVHVFATRLPEGTHEFTYLVRATTAGTFIAAPAHVEEMYEPEVFGRTATNVVEVRK